MRRASLPRRDGVPVPAVVAPKLGWAVASAMLAMSLCQAAPVPATGGATGSPSSVLEDLSSAGLGSGQADDQAARSVQAMREALQAGHWQRACGTATALLAAQVADVDALGLFGVCSAVSGDRPSTEAAMRRLAQAERPPYYAGLVTAVLQLRARSPDAAEKTLKAVLDRRGDDPLATYFQAEVQHASGRDAQAVAGLDRVLLKWPKFVPAMTALARLKSGPKASADELKSALAWADRAATLEPMNRGYQRLLADLCQRTGDTKRASAIRLQWLQPAAPPPRKP